MKKEKSIAWGKGSLALSVFLLGSLFSSLALGRSNGSILSDSSCSDCHNDGTATLAIIGPETVLPHSDNTYTLTMSGGPAVIGGLDIWAPDGGTLGLVDGLTQLLGGEITHTAPKGFSSGTVSWDFVWTAPEALGIYDLMAQGVSADQSGNTQNDFAGLTSLAIEVAAIPIPGAALLFGSALGLLGWIRRRAA